MPNNQKEEPKDSNIVEEEFKKTIRLRPEKEIYEEIKAFARQAGVTVNAWCMDAVYQKRIKTRNLQNESGNGHAEL